MNFTKTLLLTIMFLVSVNALALDKKTLEKFSQYDNNSEFVIIYDDVEAILKASVLYMGNSTRQKAKKSKASIGTRFRNKVKALTDLEGNRFHYEAFDTPEKIQLMTNVRKSLESLPSNSPLHFFSKDEQLAYWLNLYNVSLLEQLLLIYPRRNLESLTEKGQLFDQKNLLVDNEKLSLNDIKSIVIHNFGYDPLLIYGFHQGYIASPDIRREPYTGKRVWKILERNANLFINSNRGTFSDGSKTFRVSKLYEQNKAFFKDFDEDLRDHLKKYLNRSYKSKLLATDEIKTNTTNWKIADLYGTERKYGGSVSTSSAALIDAFVAKGPDGIKENVSFTNSGYMNSNITNFSPLKGRFSEAQIQKMKTMMKLQEIRKGTVTITDEEESESQEK
ncbi:DUF547 domain-containing protein [Thalassotalea castellviae]|uniref:DUF547 domain-containing protein n=1 Tax=Thalassotalea castellviae TaxID=3075612 RepID=A0ABU3A2I2_9GAMM|nr:DUF547 domain-containing protein [Thalassotalea sp. W431]MDT0604169.1 DUF547 domain-containing protein [Thalassotalea sp. W431]